MILDTSNGMDKASPKHVRVTVRPNLHPHSICPQYLESLEDLDPPPSYEDIEWDQVPQKLELQPTASNAHTNHYDLPTIAPSIQQCRDQSINEIIEGAKQITEAPIILGAAVLAATGKFFGGFGRVCVGFGQLADATARELSSRINRN